MPPEIHRIAMWSGPRNISTALMRSWESRADTIVCDEPLYAHYLKVTGKRNHPGFDEILAAHETDWKKVVSDLLASLPEGKHIFYQKHMAHHLLPSIDLDWTMQLTNCFLIREPREMLTSLIEVLPEPTIEETGLPMQLELFNRIRASKKTLPPVLDSRDVLENPRELLGKLCDAISINFDSAMLEWQAGMRESDGVWASYWYGNVAKSTTFGSYSPKQASVPEALRHLLDECEAIYSQLYQHRLY